MRSALLAAAVVLLQSPIASDVLGATGDLMFGSFDADGLMKYHFMEKT